MKPLDALCSDPTCICHERPDQSWWVRQVHQEQNGDEWLDDMARELIAGGSDFKNFGGNCDYDGLMMQLWRRMCEFRGLTAVEWLPSTVEETARLKPRKTRAASARRPVSARVRLNTYQRDGYACVLCGSHDDLTLDHIIPVAVGGMNDPDNLQTMCRPCNSRKGVNQWLSSEER